MGATRLPRPFIQPVEVMSLSTLVYDSVIRGFHVYRTYWTPKIGQILTTTRDKLNINDRYAISVLEDNVIIGHLPKEISKICSYFLKRNGSIQCQVTDTNYKRSDIPKGGLEIPAILIFFGEERDIVRLEQLLKT